VFALRTYSKLTHFDVDTFVSTLQTEGAKQVWPAISVEMDSLADEALPALKSAFAKESIE